jgi:hypothetical protein
MTATITARNGAGTTSPHFVTVPYETQWESRNVVHDLIGGDIAVSIVPPRPRSGALELLYLSEGEAFACAALHREPTAFVLTETDRPLIGMTYILTDSARVTLGTDVHAWIVTIGYQEVHPGSAARDSVL